MLVISEYEVYVVFTTAQIMYGYIRCLDHKVKTLSNHIPTNDRSKYFSYWT